MSNYRGNNYADARKKGSTLSQGRTIARQDYLKRKISGKATHIAFSIDKEVLGLYTIIDADELQPSHLGSSQNSLHFIPEAQPRNRATSASGALTPERIARNLRPEEVLYGSTAYTGSPVVNARGEVIQGNGRAYALKLYYQQFPSDPNGYQKAIEAGNSHIGLVGIKPKLAQIGINKPVLVRLVHVTDKEAIALGQFTQADTEAVSTSTTKIKSKARLLTAPVLKRVLSELTRLDDGDEKSMAELIRESNVLKVLIREDIIRPDDLENYTRHGNINEAGVEFVSSLLLNALFRQGDINTPDVFTLLPVSTQNAVKKSTIYLLKCTGSKSLNKEVSNAILAYREYLASGQSSFAGWKNQLDLQGQSPASRYAPVELAIAELFHKSSTQKEVVSRFRQYATKVNARPGTMFESASPGEYKWVAVKSVFGAKAVPDKTRIEPGRRASRALKTSRKRTLPPRRSTPPITASSSINSDTIMTTAEKEAFTKRMADGRAKAAKKRTSTTTSKKKETGTKTKSTTPAKKKAAKKKTETATTSKKKATKKKTGTGTAKKKATKKKKAATTRKKATGLKGKKAARKTTAKKKAGSVRVKTGKEQTGKNFIKEVDKLADRIHEKSATGEFVQVPVYKVSRSEAKKKAFNALRTTSKTKNVKNVRLKV
ncbi:hypothetical protein GO755_33415 [Spirosoma sp. HMF4905]|uniref:DdrB-like domain-containing protein n=1 Tax=Spirosoma arboris TaxID=2682092 RepID=A0A7K1SME5_9BACT|nr:hypothetical protein [Spirosoma arboris]MVM34975.1 hypothetical protein [Spirosoma arboris]